MLKSPNIPAEPGLLVPSGAVGFRCSGVPWLLWERRLEGAVATRGGAPAGSSGRV